MPNTALPGETPRPDPLDGSTHASPSPVELTGDQKTAISGLFGSIGPLTGELGDLFAAAGHELALVGGPVRDALLGR